MESTGPSTGARHLRLRSRPGVHGLVLAALAGSVTLAAAGLPAALAALHLPPAAPVYALPRVRAGLQHAPGAWVGRTLLLRGTLEPDNAWTCSHVAVCALRPPGFLLPDAAGSATRLAVAWGPADPLLAGLRRLPLLGCLAPQPQVPRWGTPALYRVQVAALPRPAASATYGLVILDAVLPPEPLGAQAGSCGARYSAVLPWLARARHHRERAPGCPGGERSKTHGPDRVSCSTDWPLGRRRSGGAAGAYRHAGGPGAAHRHGTPRADCGGGTGPSALALDPRTRRVFVANYGPPYAREALLMAGAADLWETRRALACSAGQGR